LVFTACPEGSPVRVDECMDKRDGKLATKRKVGAVYSKGATRGSCGKLQEHDIVLG
jgi:hypothetical protein